MNDSPRAAGLGRARGGTLASEPLLAPGREGPAMAARPSGFPKDSPCLSAPISPASGIEVCCRSGSTESIRRMRRFLSSVSPLSQSLRLPRLPGQFVGRPARSRMQILTGGDAQGPQCLPAVCVYVCVLPSSLFYNSLTG